MKVTYYRLCFGETYPVLADELPFMFENGFGVLNESTDKSLFVAMDDPLILQTSINYFGEDNEFLGNIAEQRIAGDRQPSLSGHLWEEFIPLTLINFFENNKSVILMTTLKFGFLPQSSPKLTYTIIFAIPISIPKVTQKCVLLSLL